MKRKINYTEWVDPETHEVYTCPVHYVDGFYTTLGVGVESAKTSSKILIEMGEALTEANRRHLRQASFILKRYGIPVVSLRSAKGGYFIASCQQEIDAYVAEQRKFAMSMLREAEALENSCHNIRPAMV